MDISINLSTPGSTW